MAFVVVGVFVQLPNFIRGRRASLAAAIATNSLTPSQGHPQPLVTVGRRWPCLIVRLIARSRRRFAAGLPRASQGLRVMARARTHGAARRRRHNAVTSRSPSSPGHSPAVFRLRSTKGDSLLLRETFAGTTSRDYLSPPSTHTHTHAVTYTHERTTCVLCVVCVCHTCGAIYQCKCAFVSLRACAQQQQQREDKDDCAHGLIHLTGPWPEVCTRLIGPDWTAMLSKRAYNLGISRFRWR